MGPISSYNVSSEAPPLVSTKTYMGQALNVTNVPVIGRNISSNQLIEGQFLNKQSSGMTRIINSKGYYLGNMKANMRSGKGKLVNTLGSYEGYWVENKK